MSPRSHDKMMSINLANWEPVFFLQKNWGLKKMDTGVRCTLNLPERLMSHLVALFIIFRECRQRAIVEHRTTGVHKRGRDTSQSLQEKWIKK